MGRRGGGGYAWAVACRMWEEGVSAVPVPRAYLDASVFGGLYDVEYAEATGTLFAAVEAGRLVVARSLLVAQELSRAPAHILRRYREVTRGAESLRASSASLALRDAYLAHGVVGPTSHVDALHVALATVGQCDLIVSWNFRHIVNFGGIRRYNAVNALEGYPDIAIHTPLEVVSDDD
jgi:hypothetical protein